MALLLRVGSRSRSRRRSEGNVFFFSTSNSNSNSNSDSPFSSFYNDIKDHLNPPSPSNSNSQRLSTDGIQNNLRQFRLRTTAPPPPAGDDQISFQKIYQQNKNRNPPNSKSIDVEILRKSLKNMKHNQPTQTSSSPFVRQQQQQRMTAPGSFLAKERAGDGSASSSTAFLKSYSEEDLGEKLRMLRPEGVGKDWFSVRELSERLGRLRKMEEQEDEKQLRANGSNLLNAVRGALVELKQNETQKAKLASLQGLSVLGHLSGKTIFSTDPPKPHLVEKYFHPDNMSSAEKMKIELAKVRDEFKMSESDCGSARVQIAQLTTKIKHLSAVLHKKDVHSRKGLIAMVQRRKRLLKYLRRTDWDSYCFVISKLGLRDNPDHTYKARSGMAA